MSHANQDLIETTKEADDLKNRIFLLTDGQVGNKADIVNLVKGYCNQKGNDNFRVFTFGVGNDCDKSLVKEIANAGHGSYNFCSDSNLSVLKSKIIDALSKAQEPALSNCTFDFGVTKDTSEQTSLMDPSQKFKSNQLFRNQITRYYTVMSEEQFNSEFKCTFDCEFDPKTESSMNHQFESSRFEQILPHEDMDYLFKMACKFKIDELNEAKGSMSKDMIVKLSTKYQVLSDETSFMGVVK